jgi:preprotein translocase subunit SecE
VQFTRQLAIHYEGRSVMKEKLINFFRDVVKEMEKVTWPTREELLESTRVVIIVSLVISVLTWFVDLIVSEALKAIL